MMSLVIFLISKTLSHFLSFKDLEGYTKKSPTFPRHDATHIFILGGNVPFNNHKGLGILYQNPQQRFIILQGP